MKKNFFRSLRLCMAALFMLNFLLDCSSRTTKNFYTPYGHYEAFFYWERGRCYQEEGRFQLAKQSYLMALASSDNISVQQGIQRDLLVVGRLIQGMR